LINNQNKSIHSQPQSQKVSKTCIEQIAIATLSLQILCFFFTLDLNFKLKKPKLKLKPKLKPKLKAKKYQAPSKFFKPDRQFPGRRA